jgi:hypothetical protein
MFFGIEMEIESRERKRRKCSKKGRDWNEVRSISDLLIADANNYNIIRPPQPMPMACQEFVFWIGEGDREERKKYSNL